MRPFPRIDVDASTGVTDHFAARVFATVEMSRTATSAAHIVRGAAGGCEIAFELLPSSDHALLIIDHDPFYNVIHGQQLFTVLDKIAVGAIAITGIVAVPQYALPFAFEQLDDSISFHFSFTVFQHVFWQSGQFMQ